METTPPALEYDFVSVSSEVGLAFQARNLREPGTQCCWLAVRETGDDKSQSVTIALRHSAVRPSNLRSIALTPLDITLFGEDSGALQYMLEARISSSSADGDDTASWVSIFTWRLLRGEYSVSRTDIEKSGAVCAAMLRLSVRYVGRSPTYPIGLAAIAVRGVAAAMPTTTSDALRAAENVKPKLKFLPKQRRAALVKELFGSPNAAASILAPSQMVWGLDDGSTPLQKEMKVCARTSSAIESSYGEATIISVSDVDHTLALRWAASTVGKRDWKTESGVASSRVTIGDIIDDVGTSTGASSSLWNLRSSASELPWIATNRLGTNERTVLKLRPQCTPHDPATGKPCILDMVELVPLHYHVAYRVVVRHVPPPSTLSPDWYRSPDSTLSVLLPMSCSSSSSSSSRLSANASAVLSYTTNPPFTQLRGTTRFVAPGRLGAVSEVWIEIEAQHSGIMKRNCGCWCVAIRGWEVPRCTM